MTIELRKAVAGAHRARVAIFGPSGSGKTHLALKFAAALAAPNGQTAMINTEGERGEHYAALFDYDIVTLHKYGLGDYTEAWRAVKDGGYAALVVDSFSQFWAGEGGVLEQGGKGIDAWDKVRNPIIRKLVNSIHVFPGHVIVTMRSKTEFVEEEKNGRKQFVAAGSTFSFKAEVPYEFDLLVQLEQDHRVTVLKAPPGSGLDGWTGDSFDVELIEKLVAWTKGGTA